MRALGSGLTLILLLIGAWVMLSGTSKDATTQLNIVSGRTGTNPAASLSEKLNLDEESNAIFTALRLDRLSGQLTESEASAAAEQAAPNADVGKPFASGGSAIRVLNDGGVAEFCARLSEGYDCRDYSFISSKQSEAIKPTLLEAERAAGEEL